MSKLLICIATKPRNNYKPESFSQP